MTMLWILEIKAFLCSSKDFVYHLLANSLCEFIFWELLIKVMNA